MSNQLGTNLAEVGTDCISRQAAIDLFPNDALEWDTKGGYIAPHLARQMIEELPPAQPDRIRGRWVSADAIFGGVPFYCSECGENTRDTVMGKPRWNFCPNCGAKMEVTE